MKLQHDCLSMMYLDACRLDVAAFKPGNVSEFSPGHDMAAADFTASAAASAGALTDPRLGIGERIYRAVERTRDAVGCNTNLGIILLTAPIIDAALTAAPGAALRGRLSRTLTRLGQRDAEWTYRAIRRANPAGLGAVAEQDVSEAPDVGLLQAMELAVDRDRIAYQYVHEFCDVADLGAPLFRHYRIRWKDDAWACVGVYAAIAARYRDSHIERKHGTSIARQVQARFAALHTRLHSAARPQSCLRELYMLDDDLKAGGLNPGTSADLTVASAFYAAVESGLKNFRAAVRGSQLDRSSGPATGLVVAL